MSKRVFLSLKSIDLYITTDVCQARSFFKTYSIVQQRVCDTIWDFIASFVTIYAKQELPRRRDLVRIQSMKKMSDDDSCMLQFDNKISLYS